MRFHESILSILAVLIHVVVIFLLIVLGNFNRIHIFMRELYRLYSCQTLDQRQGIGICCVNHQVCTIQGSAVVFRSFRPFVFNRQLHNREFFQVRFRIRDLIGAQLVNDFLNLIARDQCRLRHGALGRCTVSHFQSRHAFLIRLRNLDDLYRRIQLEIRLTAHQIDHLILDDLLRNFRIAARYTVAVLQCIVNRIRVTAAFDFKVAIVCNRQLSQLMNLLDALGISQLILVIALIMIIPVNGIIRAFNRCRCNLVQSRYIIVIAKDIVLDAGYHNNSQDRQYNHLLPVVQECLEVKIIDDFNNHVTQNHAKDQTKPHAARRTGKDYSED